MSRTNHNERSTLDQLMDERDPVESRINKDRMFLAVRIADLIKEKGLSKSRFAELMDRQPSVVSKWLSGAHNLTTDTLSEIAFKLGLTLTELIAGRQKTVAAPVFKRNFAVAGLPAYATRYFGGETSPLGEPGDIAIAPATVIGGIPNLEVSTHMISLGTGVVGWESVEMKHLNLNGMSARIVGWYRRGEETQQEKDLLHDFKA